MLHTQPEPRASLPVRADAVVVGGGIVGLSAALDMAEAGMSVVLCEKGRLGGEQSSRNWGWVRKLKRDPRELPLAVESHRIWEGLDRRLGAETGFRRTGIAYSAETGDQLARHEQWLAHARDHGVEARLVTGAALEALFPGMSRRFGTALHCPSDGRAEPAMVVDAYGAALRRAGVTVLENCAVRAVGRAAGAVSSAETEHGGISTPCVVVAAGIWSRRLLSDLGLRLPQLKVKNSVLRTAPVAGAPTTALWASNLAFGRCLDGGYLIADGGENISSITPDSFRFMREFLPALWREWSGTSLRVDGRFLTELREARSFGPDAPSPYELTRVQNPPADRSPRRALARLAEIYPAFRNVEVTGEWAGLIDVLPDAIPVIDSPRAVPGLVVATGLSGHGFGVGPGIGRLVAEIVQGRPPMVDLAPFSFARFERRPAKAAPAGERR